MKVLLDTHALLWALDGGSRLSRRARDVLAMTATEKLVSAVSVYEICYKHALGKLPGANALAAAFVEEIAATDCLLLSITAEHAVAAAKLATSHRDPFDRLLIAQSLVEGVPLVSNETSFDAYGVERFW